MYRAATLLLVIATAFASAGEADANAERQAAELRGIAGRHVRLVWFRRKKDNSDLRGWNKEKNFDLMCFDTRGGGERVLIGGVSGYNETVPRFTADGEWVIFSTSRWNVGVIPFAGGEPELVATGQLADVARDPETKIDWAYVFTGRARNQPIVRYNIHDLNHREPVWVKESNSFFRVSGDGKFAGGQFPWPKAGVADLTSKTWKYYGEGCWAGIAPDSSHMFMLLLGNHRALRIFDGDGTNERQIPVNQMPGVRGREVFCPVWTNDVRFLTLTAPFDPEGDPDVYLGRFDPSFTGIECWARVGVAGKADVAASAWLDSRPLDGARILSFSADRRSLTREKRVTLTWKTERATRIRIDPVPGEVAAEGKVELEIEKSTEFVLSIDGAGGPSIARCNIEMFEVLPPAAPGPTEPGLRAQYFSVSQLSRMPNFAQLTPLAEDTVRTLSFPESDGPFATSGRNEDLAALFEGFIDVPETGVWRFFCRSDDGAILKIGNTAVVNNDGVHAMEEMSGDIGLRAGRHPIRVEYFQGQKRSGLQVEYEGPGNSRRVIPAAAFSRTPAPAVKTDWPLNREKAVFVWQNAVTPALAWDKEGKPETAYKMQARGRAVLDRNYAARVWGGEYVAEGAGAYVRETVAREGALSIQATVTPATAADGTVISWATTEGTPFFEIRQLANRFSFTIRGVKDFSVDLGEVVVNQPAHLCLVLGAEAYSAFYRDGKPAGTTNRKIAIQRLPEGFIKIGGAEEPGKFWSGSVEGVTVFARTLMPTEVEADAAAYRTVMAKRPQPQRLVVDVRLTAVTEVPDPQEIAPYRKALVVNEYAVLKTVSGETSRKTIRVAQWGILDLKKQPLCSAKPGTECRLVLESFSDNPQIKADLLICKLPDSEEELYYDIGE
ncbi:MAG TPA: PA14 domain-containing protein [Planctomycetota bacterium]|nr:PA14 domain-containing protein [Planctomycetota bacterium]